MSQIAPGWYPDATGRFAQRYHDGTNWTEHVSDAAGNRSTDPMAPAAPVMPLAPPPAAPGAPGAPGAWGPPGGAPAPGFGAGYGAAPFGAPGGAPASTGFTPTIGLIAAGVGGLLVLLSLLSLGFLSGAGETVSLGDLSDAGDIIDLPVALDTYAGFGRFLGVLVAIAAMVVAARVLPPLNEVAPLPIIVAAVCGVFAVWHLAAMFSSIEGVDASPAFFAYLGLLGWVALAASPFLKQPLGSK